MRQIVLALVSSILIALPAHAQFCADNPIEHVGTVAAVTYEHQPRKDGKTYGRIIEFLKGDGSRTFFAGYMGNFEVDPPISIVMISSGINTLVNPGCNIIATVPRVEGRSEAAAIEMFIKSQTDLQEFADYRSLNSSWETFKTTPSKELALDLMPRLATLQDTIRINAIRESGVLAFDQTEPKPHISAEDTAQPSGRSYNGKDELQQEVADPNRILIESYRQARMASAQLDLAEQLVAQGHIEYEKFVVEALLNLGSSLPASSPTILDGMILGRLDFALGDPLPKAITNSSIERINSSSNDPLKIDLSGSSVEAMTATLIDFSGVGYSSTNMFALAMSFMAHRAEFLDSEINFSTNGSSDFSSARFVDSNIFFRVGRSSSFERAEFIGGRIGGSLEGADLSRSVFKGADVSSLNMDGADLSGVSIIDGIGKFSSSLRGAKLAASNLDGVDLRGVLYDQCTTFPTGFDPATAGMRLLPPGFETPTTFCEPTNRF